MPTAMGYLLSAITIGPRGLQLMAAGERTPPSIASSALELMGWPRSRAIREVPWFFGWARVALRVWSVGRLVAMALEAGRLTPVVIEADHPRFKVAQRWGHSVAFRDATHGRILSAVGIAKSKLAIVMFAEARRSRMHSALLARRRP